MGLQNPSATMTEIVTTTLRNRSGKIADNFTKNNALLYRLKRKGKVKPVSGGRTIVQELEYAENSTYKRYSGYEQLNISPSDVFTGAEFNYAQAAVAISISGLEELQNSGEEQVIDLLEGRISNAERTMTNNVALDCYSDGTADGGRQIGGLQLLVSQNPAQGMVGGIDASTSIGAFWRNLAFSALRNGGAAVTPQNIQGYMNQLWINLLRGADKTDLIVADNNYYLAYLSSLQAIQRITSSEMAEAGFESLKFMGADVVPDGGVGGGAPANSMYFLNTNYIFLRPHSARNFAPIGDNRYATNQDAMVKLIGFAGNMTCSNRRLQGVLCA
ncbi:phage major capsid protein [Chromobacterium subtsugae]|uniref:phage major capsid protein n=1 Tax=Chromobacterium subtsugae TaxID=251747 RepID=UPI0007F8E390|nr:phage major capsid protein [Chromobacterium subtsugae]OBU84578.1 3-phosphoglycerate kinase [Chromobacterium subtsugae]